MVADNTVPARFDWYAATIMERPSRLIEVLSARLGGHVVTCKPRLGYAEAVEIRTGDVVACTVYFGGAFAWPHAFASSDQTDAFVEVVRDVWPADHAVTRMDCALDFDNGDGTFDVLVALCTKLADGVRVDGDLRTRASRVRVRNVGDWVFARDGRTLYLGSPKSAVTVRCYEKGVQIIQDSEVRGVPRTDVSRNLTRLEVQVRPDGPARRRAASCDPLDAFGYSEWSRELLRRVQGEDVKRVHIRERRLSDHERAMRWMVKQYREHLIHAADLAGGWPELGESLRARILDAEHGEMDGDEGDGPLRDTGGSHGAWDDLTPF